MRNGEPPVNCRKRDAPCGLRKGQNSAKWTAHRHRWALSSSDSMVDPDTTSVYNAMGGFGDSRWVYEIGEVLREEGLVNTDDVYKAAELWREKEQGKVLIYLARNFRIEGWAHLVKNQRLLDMMNDKDQVFIPLTNVTALEMNTGTRMDADFMAVNKSEISFIMHYSGGARPELNG